MKTFIILSIFLDHEFGFPLSQIFSGCFSQRYHKVLILIWLWKKVPGIEFHTLHPSSGHWPVWILSQINNRPLCVPGTTRPLGFFYVCFRNYNTNMDSRYLRLETTMVWFWFGNGTIIHMHCLFLLFSVTQRQLQFLSIFSRNLQLINSVHACTGTLLMVERTQIKENNLWSNQMVKITNNKVLSMFI